MTEELSLKTLAIRHASNGEFKEALESYYSLREKQIEKYGLDYRVSALNKIELQIATVLYLQGEYDEAFNLFTKTLGHVEKYPEEYDDEIFEAKCYVATLYSRQMKRDAAGRIYDQLKEYIATLPVESPKMIDLKNNLAMSMKSSGELQSALDIFREIYQIRRVTYGEKSHITEYSHAEIGIVLLEQGKFKEALSILEEVHSTFRMEMFNEIFYLRLKRYLADAHMHLGLVKIAEDLCRSLMNAIKKKFPSHPEVLATMHSWGRSLAKMNNYKDALDVLNDVYSTRFVQSPKHPDTARIALDIATIHLNMKEYSDAIFAFLNVPAQISKTVKWNPDLMLRAMTLLASILNDINDNDLKQQVSQIYQHVYQKQLAMRISSNVHKDTLQTRILIAELLISLKKPDEALQVLKDVLEKRILVLKNDYTDCVDVIKNIARAYFDLKQRVEAFEYYSELYEIQKLITGDNSIEAVHWENKIREVAPEMQNTVLIDAIVSKYRTSIKRSNSENVMENNFPLHVASETGRIAMVKFLLSKGAIYNEENSEGKMPSDIACNNAVKNLFSLIGKLFLAIKEMDHEGIDKILDIMNDTSLKEDVNKGFPMLLTGLDQIHDIIDKTLLNARDKTGFTLHLACSNGDAKTVKRLLDLEVDRTLTDKSNRSPRDVAADKNFTDVLQLLDSCTLNENKDLEDSTISQKNPQMPEDIMDT